MGKPVILTGLCKCSFGAAPSPLIPLPSPVTIYFLPSSSVMDFIPCFNILPFGMCKNIKNPVVLAATIANKGILRPMPCVPIVPSPWTPVNPMVKILGKPMLVNSAKNTCIWGGSISISFPGVSIVSV